MILFFGPPGSGKSVQGQLLVERNGWKWLSTGQMFRESIDPVVKAKLAAGELIDDAMTNGVVDAALHDLKDTSNIVLDGFPRNVAQAAWLMEHLPKHGREILVIVVFDVPQEVLIDRLAGRGREEDTVDVIKRRLEIYEEQTRPVLDYYTSHNLPIAHIDGQGDITDIHDRIQLEAEQRQLV